MEELLIIDAHSHLWLKQDTSWDGKPIRSLKNGRSIFLGEEVQMIIGDQMFVRWKNS